MPIKTAAVATVVMMPITDRTNATLLNIFPRGMSLSLKADAEHTEIKRDCVLLSKFHDVQTGNAAHTIIEFYL